MIYVCGNDRDYDGWANAGSTGWDYQSILPLIKKTEKNSDATKNSTYHGFNGTLTVSDYPKNDSFYYLVEAAFKEIGYSKSSDYNARNYNGFTRLQSTIMNGERIGAYRAFIEPAKARSNLYIMKDSVVTDVIFNGTKATGVNVKTKKMFCNNIVVSATKEIILSAGALGTPKILLQSGVGRPADLSPLNITSRKNLQVGENLQNHVFSTHFIKFNRDAEAQSTQDYVKILTDYFYNRAGEATQVGSLNGQGFINTLSPTAKYPDVQLSFLRMRKNQFYFDPYLANLGMSGEYIDQLVKANSQSEIVVVMNALLNPKSRGTYKLKDKNPDSAPLIYFNFFSHPDDVSTLVRGAKKINDLVYSMAMASSGADILHLKIKECNQTDKNSDDYLKCYIKHFTHPNWHPAGTCKMGRVGDPTAVVDPELKLQGFTNIRVADPSIMPTITTGDTSCPAYAIGQKAADMIMKAWP